MEEAFGNLVGCTPGLLIVVWKEGWPHNSLEKKSVGEDPDAEDRIWKAQTTHLRIISDPHMNRKNMTPGSPGKDLRKRMDRWTADLLADGLAALTEKYREMNTPRGNPKGTHR